MCRSRRHSLSEKLLLLSFAFLAIVSPLFIDRRERIELEPDEEPIDISLFLPILLLFLIIVIVVSCCLDESFTRFDAYWIFRVGGSSGGILLILMVLALVLKCKASSPKDFMS